MNQLTVNAAAAEFHATAASIEDWMLEASDERDAHVTAIAVANAATEALVDAQAVLAMYADGWDVDTRRVQVSISILRNVLAWTRSVVRVAA